jgi:hypothetical protein
MTFITHFGVRRCPSAWCGHEHVDVGDRAGSRYVRRIVERDVLPQGTLRPSDLQVQKHLERWGGAGRAPARPCSVDRTAGAVGARGGGVRVRRSAAVATCVATEREAPAGIDGSEGFAMRQSLEPRIHGGVVLSAHEAVGEAES